ncbi:MAG: hypothetical protein WC732_01100 [Candidatus Omnitrophota bacterium]
MKTRGLVIAITIVVIFIAGIGIGDWLASARSQALIARLEGERTILKTEIERYMQVVRNIRSEATQAMPLERAQEQEK